MKEFFEEIDRLGSEKYKYYGNVFCQTSNYDVHNSITQNKIIELLAQLVGKVDELITKLPSQEKVEPIVEQKVEEKVEEKPAPKTTKRATTRKTKDSK